MLDRKAMAALGCTYKKAAALICALNIVAAFFVLQLLLMPRSYSGRIAFPRRYVLGPQELGRIQESNEIRRQVKLHKLIRRVKEINSESELENAGPAEVRRNAASEIVQRLQNQTVNRKVLREWRRAEVREHGNVTEDDLYRMLAEEEAAKLEELGWFDDQAAEQPTPSDPVDDNEYADVEIEEGIIPGRKLPPECHAEAHTDYDGIAVRWGLSHHTDSAADCCQACLDQARSPKPGERKCNVWVFCAAENGCYSPDIYEHKHQECWLKQADQPKLNFKGRYQEEYRQTHPNTPLVVPWVSGVVTV